MLEGKKIEILFKQLNMRNKKINKLGDRFSVFDGVGGF